jgi:hypothetical protein
MSGYYRMHREWMDNPVLAGEPYTRAQAWCWLIENARYRDGDEWINGDTVTVLRGQVCKAYRYMAKAWQWDESRVRRFCKSLEKAQMIRCDAAAGRALLTICNYDVYQADECGDAAAPDASSPQHRRSTAANKKEGKEGNIYTPLNPPSDKRKRGDEFAEEFAAEFWPLYPRKVARDAALMAYAKARLRAEKDAIIAGVRRYGDQCRGKDTEFVAHASTWLNQGRWDDEPAKPTQTSSLGPARPTSSSIHEAADFDPLKPFRPCAKNSPAEAEQKAWMDRTGRWADWDQRRVAR